MSLGGFIFYSTVEHYVYVVFIFYTKVIRVCVEPRGHNAKPVLAAVR